MSRRFELPYGPLLARLGYTRPDEEPLPSTDETRPVYVVGDARYQVASPGFVYSRWFADIPANALAQATAMFTAPPGGAWIHELVAFTAAGGFYATGTCNGTPGVPVIAAAGTRGAAWASIDARETSPILGIESGHSAAVTLSDFAPPFAVPVWWQMGLAGTATDTRIVVQAATVNEAMQVVLGVMTPLVGMRR